MRDRVFHFKQLLARIGDMPHRAAAVVGNEQAAILGDSEADGTAPDLAVGGDETGEEVVVLAGRATVVHGDADDLIAGAVQAVPAPVLGGEGVAVVAGWEVLFL